MRKPFCAASIAAWWWWTAQLTVRTWNRWSENAWGLREEEVIGHRFGELDIGLPAKRARRHGA